MYAYYNKDGDIVTLSEIEISVEGTSMIQISEDTEPSKFKIVKGKLVKRDSELQTFTSVTDIKPLDENIIFLNSTDFKVTKYRDQKDLGITPDLTEAEYLVLLQQRQDARVVQTN
jgi:hypothetical protein